MIVVTTPTGNIGAKVVQGLLDRSAPVRVIVRDAARLPPEVRSRVEIVEGSHGDADGVRRAFAGAETVFWLVPPDYRTDNVIASYVDFTKPAAEAMVSEGVKRVVAVSVLGRDQALAENAGLVTASLGMRELIAGTGVDLRSLALPNFVDNMLTQVGALKGQGAFYDMMPADLAQPTCTTNDIAAAAVRLLLDDSWTGQDDVPVLGPEDLSANAVAAILSEVLGRPIHYQQVPAKAYKANLMSYGMSDAMAQGVVDMRLAKAKGLDNLTPRTAETASPTSFRQWAEQVLKPALQA